MNEKVPAQNGQKKAEKAIVIKKQVIAGALVVLAVVAALVIYGLSGQKSHPVAEDDAPVIGTFDLQQMMRQHKDYAKLQSLEQEIGQLSAAMAVQEMQLEVKLPKVNEQAFGDGAEPHTEINAMAAEQRQKWQPQLNAELTEAAKPYENQLLNLSLKVENAEVLGLSEDDDVWFIRRIDRSQGEAVALEEIYIPYEVLPGLGDVDLQLFSIYDMYLWNGIQPEVGKQVLRISRLEPSAAKLIDIEAGQAVMEFSCVTQDTTGRIIEFARNYIRGDKTEFTVHYTNQ